MCEQAGGWLIPVFPSFSVSVFLPFSGKRDVVKLEGFCFFLPFSGQRGFLFFPASVSEKRGADGLEGGGQLASVLIRRFTFAETQTILLKALNLSH